MVVTDLILWQAMASLVHAQTDVEGAPTESYKWRSKPSTSLLHGSGQNFSRRLVVEEVKIVEEELPQPRITH
jgi:hypothetical protein